MSKTLPSRDSGWAEPAVSLCDTRRVRLLPFAFAFPFSLLLTECMPMSMLAVKPSQAILECHVYFASESFFSYIQWMTMEMIAKIKTTRASYIWKMHVRTLHRKRTWWPNWEPLEVDVPSCHHKRPLCLLLYRSALWPGPKMCTWTCHQVKHLVVVVFEELRVDR